MTKRPSEDVAGHSHTHKKHKQDHSHRKDDHSHQKHRNSNDTSDSHQSYPGSKYRDSQPKPQTHARSHDDALDQLPPPTSKSGDVPSYVHFTVPLSLPPLPPVKDGELSIAPFKHKSTVSYNRSSSTTDITYERLEFLGDAYIELIASRLIFERFTHLPAGQQSQLRELLVKNETLAEYSRAYDFDKRVEVGALVTMVEDSKHKGNKGFNKVCGDVFEAYVAAVILSDAEDGFAVVEKWLTALWAPKLVKAAKNNRGYAYNPSLALMHGQDVDLLKVYNPNAKGELQKRIVGSQETRLIYETYKDTVELKGDQLGQNRHFIALYLTGYGYERKLLGKGEGKNKVEAGNWAATEAMHGNGQGLVEECETRLKAEREERKAKRAAEESGKDVER